MFFVELDAFAELDTAVPPPEDVDAPLPEDSIMPSLAQPLTMSPNNMIANAFINRSMMIPPREKMPIVPHNPTPEPGEEQGANSPIAAQVHL